jgi:hypothetical protein
MIYPSSLFTWYMVSGRNYAKTNYNQLLNYAILHPETPKGTRPEVYSKHPAGALMLKIQSSITSKVMTFTQISAENNGILFFQSIDHVGLNQSIALCVENHEISK